MKRKFLKVAIYIRVSTREQAESGYSIGEQESRLRKYCDAMSWGVADVYIDPGYSGASTDRPALQNLLNDVNEGRVDCVLVWKLDRLSRSQKDTLHLIEDIFMAEDVAFVSTLENFDTSTPFGRAMIGILSVFAQLEREQIKERMQLGLDARAKTGKWHGGGYDPYGYDYTDGQLQINEAEAENVRLIFSLYTEKRWAINKIRKYMAERHSTKYGQFSSDSTINSIITNPIYLGRITWKGNTFEGDHEAIISEEVFDKAQRLKEETAWTPLNGRQKSPFESVHLLGGLIFCGHCGARYFGKGNYSGRGEHRVYRPYYTCYSRGKTAKSMIVDPKCKNKSFPVCVLDELVSDEIRKLSFDRKAVIAMIKEAQGAGKDNSRKRAAIEAEIKDAESQIARLIELCKVGGLMPVQAIAQQIEGLQASIDKSNLKLSELANSDKPAVTASEYAGRFVGAAKVLDNGTFEEKRELVKSLIDKIVIEEDESVSIHWSFEPKSE